MLELCICSPMSLPSVPNDLLGELPSLPTGSLAAHPQPDVRRAMLQHDALCFAGDEEVHDRDVHQGHLLQVEHEPRAVPPHLGLELLQILRLDATDESKRPALAVGHRFDLLLPLMISHHMFRTKWF